MYRPAKIAAFFGAVSIISGVVLFAVAQSRGVGSGGGVGVPGLRNPVDEIVFSDDTTQTTAAVSVDTNAFVQTNDVVYTTTVGLAASALQEGDPGTSTNLSDYNNNAGFLTNDIDADLTFMSNALAVVSNIAVTASNLAASALQYDPTNTLQQVLDEGNTATKDISITGTVAIGTSTVASGSYSFAGGNGSEASGESAMAFGENCIAAEWGVFAGGLDAVSRAGTDASIVYGSTLFNDGAYNAIFGINNIVSNFSDGNIVGGRLNKIYEQADNNLVVGEEMVVSNLADYSVALGRRGHVLHSSAFVWAHENGSGQHFDSVGANTFNVQAESGFFLEGSIIPVTSNSWSLGAPTSWWDQIFVQTLNVAGATINIGTQKITQQKVNDWDGAVGDAASFVDSLALRSNVYYVAEYGSDTNTGLSPFQPFRSVTQGFEQADILAGSLGVGVVHVLDTGPYGHPNNSDLEVPSKVFLYAPFATFTNRMHLANEGSAFIGYRVKADSGAGSPALEVIGDRCYAEVGIVTGQIFASGQTFIDVGESPVEIRRVDVFSDAADDSVIVFKVRQAADVQVHHVEVRGSGAKDDGDIIQFIDESGAIEIRYLNIPDDNPWNTLANNEAGVGNVSVELGTVICGFNTVTGAIFKVEASVGRGSMNVDARSLSLDKSSGLPLVYEIVGTATMNIEIVSTSDDLTNYSGTAQLRCLNWGNTGTGRVDGAYVESLCDWSFPAASIKIGTNEVTETKIPLWDNVASGAVLGVSEVMSVNKNAAGGIITNHGTPTANADVATKAYVDGQVAAAGATNSIESFMRYTTSTVMDLSADFSILTNFSSQVENGIVVDGPAGTMTIQADGRYFIGGFLSFLGGGNTVYDFSFFSVSSGGVTNDLGINFKRKTSNNDVGAGGMGGFADLSIGDVITIRARFESGTTDPTMEAGQFAVHRVVSSAAGTNWSQYPAVNNADIGGNDIVGVGTQTLTQGQINNWEDGYIDTAYVSDYQTTNEASWLQVVTNVSTAPFDGYATVRFSAYNNGAYGGTPPGATFASRFTTNNGFVANSSYSNAVFLSGDAPMNASTRYQCSDGDVYTNRFEIYRQSLVSDRTQRIFNATLNIEYGKELP